MSHSDWGQSSLNEDPLRSTSSDSSKNADDAVLRIQIAEDGQIRVRSSSRISSANKLSLMATLERWLSATGFQSPEGNFDVILPTEEDCSQQLAGRPLLQIQCDETAKWRTWFSEAFAALQQQACRYIAKEWIRAIHPRKQSSHPYNGMLSGKNLKCPEDTRPEYWPQDVEHKEPDHIDKAARIKLLTHLLTKTPHVELNTGSMSPRCFNAEILLHTLMGKSHEHLQKKWPILREAIGVRTILENYERGLLDGDEVLTVHDFSAKSKSLSVRNGDIARFERRRPRDATTVAGMSNKQQMWHHVGSAGLMQGSMAEGLLARSPSVSNQATIAALDSSSPCLDLGPSNDMWPNNLSNLPLPFLSEDYGRPDMVVGSDPLSPFMNQFSFPMDARLTSATADQARDAYAMWAAGNSPNLIQDLEPASAGPWVTINEEMSHLPDRCGSTRPFVSLTY